MGFYLHYPIYLFIWVIVHLPYYNINSARTALLFVIAIHCYVYSLYSE